MDGHVYESEHLQRGFLMRFILAACLALTASPVLAWTLDDTASSISYVTIKNGDTAEANLLTSLEGSVSEEGIATVDISLASVETFIDIRNERMREILFQVADFPLASIAAEIDMEKLAAMGAGETAESEFGLTVETHGTTANYGATAYVTRISEDRVIVNSKAPVIVYASDLGYEEGIAKLREIAGLDSIQTVVPVSFNLAFDR